MCIVFVSTTHPKYALILADNRDEYVLRPTSRPHWWKHPQTGLEVLSSRDLHRPEMGTWLGISRTGQVAVLTNYRELDNTAAHPIHAGRSRGGMVTAWLGEPAGAPMRDSIDRFVRDGGVQGVGGFSMVCGKLRSRAEGLAIVSNRASHVDEVPVFKPDRTKALGLSNAAYDKSESWPKVTTGTPAFEEIVREHAASLTQNDDELVSNLFGLLSRDTFPAAEASSLQEAILLLRKSIYIPLIGDARHRAEMEAARAKGKGTWATVDEQDHEPPSLEEATNGFEGGMYGTQRQTVLLVDRDGKVKYVERALWDANGHEVPKGEGDVVEEFQIEGWEQ
jgi:uncharacterized protein with NRDE domain